MRDAFEIEDGGYREFFKKEIGILNFFDQLRRCEYSKKYKNLIELMINDDRIEYSQLFIGNEFVRYLKKRVYIVFKNCTLNPKSPG